MGVFSVEEMDVIGEIMNISMGSAATAVSSMLDKQVLITTPKVSVKVIKEVDYSSLEPAMVVKITYVEGIKGANIMVFRQNDMQLIINQLMGNSMPVSNEFIFDEFSISAACEVMNQMMGSSATALSQFLGKKVDISTPEASLFGDDTDFTTLMNMSENDEVVAITFDLDIKDIMNSEFISVMPLDLAKVLVSQFTSGGVDPVNDVAIKNMAPHTNQAPPQQQMQQQQMQQQAPQQQMQQPQMQQQQQMQQQAPQQQMQQPQMQQQQMQQQYAPVHQEYAQQQYAQQNVPVNNQAMYQQQAPNYNQNYQGQPQQRQDVSFQSVEFPRYMGSETGGGIPLMNNNLDLIMNVPLNVSIEVGKTKKKIKDIMDFSQGTVLELEKQAGAPVDIIVNGQLIARGDVVVIDDNFAVRVTGIVNKEELMETVIGKK